MRSKVNPQEVDVWLRHIRAFWSQHLDALATEILRGKRERLMANPPIPTWAPSPTARRTPMLDIDDQVRMIHREVGRRSADGGELVGVVLRRRYDAPVDDVWNALTEPDRVKRWFLPISGDLREGGSFQLEGNASGDILKCAPPRLLRVTFGGPTSIVELRLTPEGDGETVFELEHNVPLEMAGSAAGALYVGPGWDGAVMALGLYLKGEIAEDPVAMGNSREGQEFSKASVDAWVAVVEASGDATAEQITSATAMAMAQFAPDLAESQNGNTSN